LAAAAVVEGAAAATVVEDVEDFPLPLPSPSAFWALFLSGLA
jgi:hypothetical protein